MRYHAADTSEKVLTEQTVAVTITIVRCSDGGVGPDVVQKQGLSTVEPQFLPL